MENNNDIIIDKSITKLEPYIIEVLSISSEPVTDFISDDFKASENGVYEMSIKDLGRSDKLS